MISIIIPTLNEEGTISATLAYTLSLAGEFEIIIVDGGSEDATLDTIIQDERVHVTSSKKGRALQMNHGASLAKGQFLLFLHADTILPKTALTTINSHENKSDIEAGGFLHRFSGNDWRLSLISLIDNYRCRRSRIFYGDQAFFIRKTLFLKLGGFPQQPILEDWQFGNTLRQVTKPIIIHDPVITDSRKFEKAGVWKSFARITTILTRLKFGLPVSKQHPFFQDIR